MTITVKNLSKKFPIQKSGIFMFNKSKKQVEVLKNINLEVAKGKIVGITGPNGSGKTTLLKIISGILKPTSGEIKAEGKIISLFTVPSALDHRLSLKDSVYSWCAFAGLSKKEVDKIYDSIIEKAELGEFKNAGPRQFSLGMITRVMMSIGLHLEADVIILDEVFSPLDQEFREKTVKNLKTLANQGAIVLIASHDKELVEQNCDQTIKIENGIIIA